MKSLLIGESASEEDEAAIAAAIVAADSVTVLIDLRTEHIGPESILVAAKVQFDQDLTMRQLADVVDAARPDTVIHLAAISHVPTATADPALAWDVNVTATARLLHELGRARDVAAEDNRICLCRGG